MACAEVTARYLAPSSGPSLLLAVRRTSRLSWHAGTNHEKL
jgi:hypothetical protein